MDRVMLWIMESDRRIMKEYELDKSTGEVTWKDDELVKRVDYVKQYATKEEIELLNRLLDSYILASNNDGFKKNRIPNIKDDRDEIYNAWRKSWGYGIPSKQGEEVFNAHGRGFQEGWRAAEAWMKNK